MAHDPSPSVKGHYEASPAVMVVSTGLRRWYPQYRAGGIHHHTRVVSTAYPWYPHTHTHTPVQYPPPHGGKGRLDVEGVPHKAMTTVGHCWYYAGDCQCNVVIASAVHRDCQCSVRLLVQVCWTWWAWCWDRTALNAGATRVVSIGIHM